MTAPAREVKKYERHAEREGEGGEEVETHAEREGEGGEEV